MGADQRLIDEIINDPLGRSYSGMNDLDLTNSLNALDRTENKASMSASEVFNQIVPAALTGLTDADRLKIFDVLHMGEVNPFGLEAQVFIDVFGGGSATITALNAARVTAISRAHEIGLSFVSLGSVIAARAV